MIKELNSGDKFKRVSPYGYNIYEVTHTTKTEIIAQFKDSEGYLHEARFQRKYDLWDEISGRAKLYPVPRQSGISLIEYYILKD